ncbi:MAG TPA: hypothetical protein VK688_13255 [Gemmatimonadales bacterium]|jgi:hypothetical protein|nr:hypothetical protein [Gemmatimonadales bacterium]
MPRTLFVIACLAVAGCKGNSTTAGTGHTERERDSIIGQSKVPGAGVVQRALDVSDSAQHRGARLDSAAAQP